MLVGDPRSRVSGCAGNTFRGPVTVVGGKAGTRIGGNSVTGRLACRGNTPPPVNGGRPNAVSGARNGQCVARRF